MCDWGEVSWQWDVFFHTLISGEENSGYSFMGLLSHNAEKKRH